MENYGLDLFLINVGGTKKRVYQELSKDYSAIEPPFWAALTAGFIRKKGFSVDILDANAENLTYEETAKLIEEKNPRFVNIVVYGQHPSASTQLMTGVGTLCNLIKSENKERKIILTGLHPSAVPKRTIEEENCDFVCEGEGFYTILELLKNKSLNEIPGLWWKEEEKIKNNLRSPNVLNLTEELDEVAWDLLLLKKGKYKAHNWQCLDNLGLRPYYASLSTSMGCPFNCNFCSIKATFGGERRIRYWDPNWVLNQIDILVKEYNVKVIKIIDEMFIFNSEHYLKIADGLIERNYDLNIWAYARVDITKNVNIDTLRKLRKAGFKWLCLGFEAGSEEVLQDVKKGTFTKQDMLDVSKKVRDAGINILANFLFGLPEDNFDTMQETLDLAIKMNCEFANFYCTTAWPGSELYREVLEKNTKLPKKWEDYAQHAYAFIPLPTNNLSPKEILEFRDYAFDTYFKNPRYLKMIEEKFGKQAREHIEEMTNFKLKRKLYGDIK
ncbi:MAG: B12-binding domain-containing radical SAM protein [Nanoarchaeota archaeon]|nr:B12-binding domain-containing radical SAM protein [Nanoarchaeota archaeon]MBU1028062.1 B12-binding domain-containing radical SAM protein [Nanoarchaeota archaeon]